MGDQMTDQKAAKILAQHITTLRSEQADMTRYLYANDRDPWSPSHSASTSTALFTEAMHSSIKNDRENKHEKVRVAFARRACAATVLDALLVAKSHCDDEFRGMIEKEMFFADQQPMFKIDSGSGGVGATGQDNGNVPGAAEGGAGTDGGEEGEEMEEWSAEAEEDETPRRRKRNARP